MQPIIFSHGDMANCMDYTVLCRELASYGYIVFALGHQDGSCSYTVGANGESIFYDIDVPITDFDAKGEQLNFRTNEILELRKELEAMTPGSDFYVQVFGDEFDTAILNMEKFTLCGHSFGGGTVINAASELTSEKCHCVLTMDPWLRTLQDKLKSEEFAFDVDVQI